MTSRKGTLRLLSYGLFIGIILACEFGEELFPASEEGEAPLGRFESHAYWLLTKAGYRPHRPRYAQLVTLSRKNEGEEVMNNLCTQREFLSVVVDNLVAIGATGIVID